jgi:hypothetical protein
MDALIGTDPAARRGIMVRSIRYVAVALVTLVACADAPESDDATGAGGKADGSLTTLRFTRNWSEKSDGPLVAGRSIRIQYDLDRLTDCRGSTNGSDVWGITGYASFDGGEPQVFEVTRLVDGRAVAAPIELALPARAERVEFWFSQSNRWGCIAYDSNDSANYAFDLEQRANLAVASFEASYDEDLPTDAKVGDQLLVHYDPARLSECSGSTMGNAAWAVTLNYQVDAGAVKQLLVTRANGPDLVPSDPEITLPRGRDLAMWFEATSRWGCHAYDSNLNANYHITINE